jgi:NTE family protein
MIENGTHERDWKRMEGKLQSETVLVLQGGGSLGAYECGVYKALYRHGIKFDILAGSSIGAVNASMICSAQNASKNAAKVLEDFWLTLADKNNTPELLPIFSLLSLGLKSSSTLKAPTFFSSSPHILEDKIMASLSSLYSAACGNAKAFMPRWFISSTSPDYYLPYKWNYVYDTSPLKETLKEFYRFYIS